MCSAPTVIHIFTERRKSKNEDSSDVKASIAVKDAGPNDGDPPKLEVRLEENASELQAVHEVIVSSGTDTGNARFKL